jgi:uncharacterized membrane-anchored protein
VSDQPSSSGPTPSGSERQSALSARIARVEASVNKAIDSVAEQQIRTVQQRDRSWIARQIIWMFVIAVIAVLVILALQGWLTGNWEKVATEATDLVKSAVLPIVTLVLGYYFGQSDKG